MTGEVWVGVVSGLVIAGIPSAIAVFAVRKKTKAETVDIITESAERIILRLESIIARLEEEKGSHLKEVMELKREVQRLRGLIILLGHDPDGELDYLRKRQGDDSGNRP